MRKIKGTTFVEISAKTIAPTMTEIVRYWNSHEPQGVRKINLQLYSQIIKAKSNEVN